MRVGLYARVSTHDQQTLPMQLKQMKEYIKNRKWKLTTEVQEVGSGAKTRPKREELLKMARRREIDAILVWKLDRFGRSLADLITTLNELRDLNVVFVSLRVLRLLYIIQQGYGRNAFYICRIRTRHHSRAC